MKRISWHKEKKNEPNIIRLKDKKTMHQSRTVSSICIAIIWNDS